MPDKISSNIFISSDEIVGKSLVPITVNSMREVLQLEASWQSKSVAIKSKSIVPSKLESGVYVQHSISLPLVHGSRVPETLSGGIIANSSSALSTSKIPRSN